MSFEKGSVTFRVMQLPQPLPDDALHRFADRIGRDIEDLGIQPEIAWVSGRHLLDNEITEATAIRGGYIYLNLRYAERRVPPALARAHYRMAELRFIKENGRPPKRKERQDMRREIQEALKPKMPPSLRGIPIVIDHKFSFVYVGATSETQLEDLQDQFRGMFEFEPVPVMPEVWATDTVGVNPESLPRLNFSPTAPGPDENSPIGRDFLTWLWYMSEEGAPDGIPVKQYGRVAVGVDGPLTFLASASAANESVVRRGTPTASAEAKAALEVGKKLKRAHLAVQAENSGKWTLNIDADDFVFRSVKLPEGEATEEHAIFEERITCIYLLVDMILGLFEHFLQVIQTPGTFKDLQEHVQRWVARREGR